jgi:hypothetical protein
MTATSYTMVGAPGIAAGHDRMAGAIGPLAGGPPDGGWPRSGRGCSSDGQRKILTICEVPH